VFGIDVEVWEHAEQTALEMVQKLASLRKSAEDVVSKSVIIKSKK